MGRVDESIESSYINPKFYPGLKFGKVLARLGSTHDSEKNESIESKFSKFQISTLCPTIAALSVSVRGT